MSKYHFISILLISMAMFGQIVNALAEDRIELEVSVIKGNKELPKVLYIVPWKRLKGKSVEQKLVLHSLFEDAFEPINPDHFKNYVENYNYFTK